MKDKKWRFIEKTLRELENLEIFLILEGAHSTNVRGLMDLVVTSLQALANDDQELITIFVYEAEFGERDVVFNIDSESEFWIRSYADLREIMEITYGL